MTTARATATLAQFVAGYCAPIDRRPPSVWAEQELYLPPGQQESKPGPVNWDYAPYLREIVDCRTDPAITDVYVRGPTRSGKTFILRVDFAYSIAVDPSPSLWVDSTVEKARGVSKKELLPLVEANPQLRDRKPANRHYFTTTEMLFPGASFTMYGANSDAQVSGDTVKIVRGNEIDKWRDATEKEASIIEQARHRTESYEAERYHIWSSTPTTETGAIELGYQTGDQRQWFMPCPCCGHHQHFKWEQIKWDPAARLSEHEWNLELVAQTAYYECENPDCRSPWPESARHATVRAGHWVPTAKPVPGIRSYAILGPMVMLQSSNYGALAVDFLSSRRTGFFQDRQDFWNSRWGQPWKDDINANTITHENFAKLERSYLRGTLPEGFIPDAIITGADVQTWGLPWVTRAVKFNGESYTIDHGVSAAFDDLERVQSDYAHFGKSFVVIDINFEHRAAETKEAIYRRLHLGWIAAEGFEFAKQNVALEKTDAFIGGRLQREKLQIPVLRISTYEFKNELAKRFTGEQRGWYTYQLPLTADDREAKEQQDYYAQLLDERRVPRRKRRRGQPEFEWKDRGNNHAFDCEVYILALLYVLTKNQTFARRAPSRRREIQVKTG